MNGDVFVQDKPLRRIREWLEIPGRFSPGPRNAISDVEGVSVGHHTLIDGSDVRTGVSIVRPHAGDPFALRCPCGLAVGNGFGKMTGIAQIQELGELESLIALTNTLSVAAAMQGLLEYHLIASPASLRSINLVVGETNDSHLNDIRRCSVHPEHVAQAITACSPQFATGAVGAGTGTVCFGYKGGIGSASRQLPASLLKDERDYSLGVLVQSNYGGNLSIYGHPIPSPSRQPPPTRGSCMILLATDAPLDARQLTRLARRGMAALAQTGSYLGHGSGDFCLAFSNHARNLRPFDSWSRRSIDALGDDGLSVFFEAAVEATVEALYDSLTLSPTTLGFAGHQVQGLNLAQFATQLPLKPF